MPAVIVTALPACIFFDFERAGVHGRAAGVGVRQVSQLPSAGAGLGNRQRSVPAAPLTSVPAMVLLPVLVPVSVRVRAHGAASDVRAGVGRSSRCRCRRRRACRACCSDREQPVGAVPVPVYRSVPPLRTRLAGVARGAPMGLATPPLAIAGTDSAPAAAHRRHPGVRVVVGNDPGPVATLGQTADVVHRSAARTCSRRYCCR